MASWEFDSSSEARQPQRRRPRPAWLAVAALALIATALAPAAAPESEQDWTHYVRIAAWPLTATNATAIIRQAQQSDVFGIEADNDVTGRYESFLDPRDKLAAIHHLAEEAHKAGNPAFVYIAGLECITANAGKSAHTLAKDHPDWLQRKRTGEPAVFGSGTAFWIAPGDEDVWISPYAREWRKLYMERVRQIAATGIDGIYVDIPYWMTHFEGWEDSWASFDDSTVAAFRARSGLDARQLRLGDFSDPGFRQWIQFRMDTITDFMAEIDRAAKAVNPTIKTIPEIYPGIEEEAVRVGADVYSLYAVNDAIAHEYEYGGGDHMASTRTLLDWFRYQVGMQSFRAFGRGKPTWILNYSWDGDEEVEPRESMQNLFMSEIMAGANPWDARGHVMSGSNDLATRQEVFSWIADNEQTFFRPRKALQPVGVYFSPATRNFFPIEHVRSYQGVLILLMQEHLEYQVVTPRTLAEFHGKRLVLPDVRLLGPDERQWLQQFVDGSGTLIVTGTDTTGLGARAALKRYERCPGKAYLDALEKDFASAAADPQFVASLRTDNTSVSVSASRSVATQIAEVDGKTHVFFANFTGLRPRRNARQTPESGATVLVTGSHSGTWLPFLGTPEHLPAHPEAGATRFALPRIVKGGVLWVD